MQGCPKNPRVGHIPHPPPPHRYQTAVTNCPARKSTSWQTVDFRREMMSVSRRSPGKANVVKLPSFHAWNADIFPASHHWQGLGLSLICGGRWEQILGKSAITIQGNMALQIRGPSIVFYSDQPPAAFSHATLWRNNWVCVGYIFIKIQGWIIFVWTVETKRVLFYFK